MTELKQHVEKTLEQQKQRCETETLKELQMAALTMFQGVQHKHSHARGGHGHE